MSDGEIMNSGRYITFKRSIQRKAYCLDDVLSHIKKVIPNDKTFMFINTQEDRRCTKAVTIVNLVVVVGCILFKDCSSFCHI